MKILIRTDASVEIGSGHLMRCLTLADHLQQKGAEVVFACRNLIGGMVEAVTDRGYQCVTFPVNSSNSDSQQYDAEETLKAIEDLFPGGFDWLIVDQYELDVKWEGMFQRLSCKVMVIDDLANRLHECDILLDQNYYINMESRYEKLVPIHTKKFLGLEYLLLRNEFESAFKLQEKRSGLVKRVLMFFGGSDTSHETLKAINALTSFNHTNIIFDIVVGNANSDSEKIKKICASKPSINYHFNIKHIAELMSKADLGIIAAGSTTWEASYLSLPVITIMTAQNQYETISTLAKKGIIWNLGWHYEINSDDITRALEKACESPEKLVDMGRRAKQLMGLSKGISKVIDSVMGYSND